MTPDIAIALDYPNARDALRMVDAAGEQGRWYKVGAVLYVREGPVVIRELLSRGKRVFLDLKWHDIPNTVRGAVSAASELGVHLATLHLAGGSAMIAAAVEARGPLRLAGVGVLTSLDAAGYSTVVGRAVSAVSVEQQRWASVAVAAGLDALVCAAGDAAAVRPVIGPDRWLVVPGIRGPGDATADQVRTASPQEAVRAGADLLVVGRPITAASNPKAALAEFQRAIAA